MCHFPVKKEKKSCHKNSALLQPPEVVLRCSYELHFCRQGNHNKCRFRKERKKSSVFRLTAATAIFPAKKVKKD